MEVPRRGGGQTARELYFIGPDGKLMAASAEPSATTFRAGPPAALFATGMRPDGFVKHEYAVARDGRFLMPAAPPGGTISPVTLLLNWRLPAR